MEDARGLQALSQLLGGSAAVGDDEEIHTAPQVSVRERERREEKRRDVCLVIFALSVVHSVDFS
jgi:hypothetical protein